MGCGESKLAVATGNTILRRKKPKAGTGDSIKKGKDIGTVSENATEYDSTRPQQHDQQGAITEQAVNRVDNVDDLKDINETKKENGDDKQVIEKSDNKVVAIPEHDAGRLITSEDSPRSFFSSRKLDEEGIDGIISEGRSGTSDYYTPRHGRVNSFFKGEESGGAVEDKESLPAPEETKLAETTATTTNDKGEAVVLVEETLVKEPAEVEITATVVEAAVPNPAAEGTKKVDIEKEETKKDEITKKEEKK